MSVIYCINPEININSVKKLISENLGPFSSGYISKDKIAFNKISYERVSTKDVMSNIPDEIDETDIIYKFVGPWEFCENFIPSQSYFVKEF